MGWQDDEIISPVAKQSSQPWENDAVVMPAARAAHGIQDAFAAGWQNSATGFMARGKLPDVQLDPQHSTWYERLIAGGTQMAADLPEMVVGGVGGAIGGAALGTLAAPGIGTAIGGLTGGGAGSFALPAAIRESYIQALSKGEVAGAGDFLSRAAIVLKNTSKEALVGAATAGAGKLARVGAATAGLGERAAGAAALGAEAGTLVVAPAALEGRLPEPQDFMDAAILLVGLKGAGHVAGRLRTVYEKTGKTPVEVLADAKADPTIAEDLAKGTAEEAPLAAEAKKGEQLNIFAEKELPKAYEPLARDMNAREAVSIVDPKAAGQFIEKPFAEIPQAKGEPVLPTHVNYNFLNTTEDVKGAMSRLSELYEQKMRESTRGTVPWEQTYAEAKSLYEQTTGEKAPDAPSDANYQKLSADLYARKQLLIAGAEQLMAMRNAYAEARKAGTATEQQKLELLAQIERVATAQATARGAQAEVGRALNVLKSTNRDAAYYDQLNKVLNDRFNVDGKFGDRNFDSMIDAMGDIGSPDQALKFAAKAAKATTWDKTMEAWKSFLVSGPITQVANIMGNATFMATRPLVDAVAVAVGRLRLGEERLAAVEPLARVTGNIMGVVDGARAAASSFVNGGAVEKTEARRNAIEGRLGNAVRIPFRLLGAADAFFRVVNERGEAYTLATRQATEEGYNPATREFRDRVLEIARDPSEDMAKQIEDAGVRFTFNTPLGDKGQAVQGAIRKLHLEWAVPFVQTPANVAKEMMRLTPAAPIVGEWRAAFAEGGAARDKAVSEMVIGTAVGTAVFSLALSGNISGQGDPDPKKRAVAMAAGWQPYSIKVGGTWYSIQRLQPIGTLIGMAADMAEVWEHLTPDESDKIPKILSTAFANAITNQTFLQGITNIVNAISDPSRFGPRFVQGLAGSLVPALVAQPAQMMDPYQREIDSVMDAVKSRIPGLRETLMPKRDAYGEKIEAKDRMGYISPITTSDESTDKVRQEAKRLQIGVAKAPDHIELPSGRDAKLGRVALTPQQQDVFATESGKMAYHVLDQMVHSPTWDNMSDLQQRNAMNMVFEKSKMAGKAAAVPPEQLRAEANRIATEIYRRMQPK